MVDEHRQSIPVEVNLKTFLHPMNLIAETPLWLPPAGSERRLEPSNGRGEKSRRVAWLAWPAALAMLGLLLMLVIRVPEQADAAALALLNGILGTGAIVTFARRPSTEALVPVLFLPMVVVSWPLGSLYYMIFDPAMVYRTKWHVVRILDQNIRLQLCTFLFLVSYLPIVFMALRRSAAGKLRPIANPHRVADAMTFFSTLVIFANAASKIVPLPSLLVYLIDGLWIYFQGLLFVSGALYTHLSKKMKTYLAFVLPATVLFYTLGNARGMAIVPCLLFGLGLLFFSEVKQKTKLIILVAAFFLMPAYVVIGNTTRVLGHGIGFQDLGTRWEALQEWERVAENASFLGQTFARLFHVSGQRIVTTTPDKYPFVPFDLLAYLEELFLSVLPQRFFFKAPFYSGSEILLTYGFNISDTTAVEVSMIGSFYLLGGNLAVFLGGGALGLVHTVLILVLRSAGRSSGLKPLFLLGVLGGSLIGMTGHDLIHQWRRYVWCLLIGHAFYPVVSAITRERSCFPGSGNSKAKPCQST